jgi:hypothetical protein
LGSRSWRDPSGRSTGLLLFGVQVISARRGSPGTRQKAPPPYFAAADLRDSREASLIVEPINSVRCLRWRCFTTPRGCVPPPRLTVPTRSIAFRPVRVPTCTNGSIKGAGGRTCPRVRRTILSASQGTVWADEAAIERRRLALFESKCLRRRPEIVSRPRPPFSARCWTERDLRILDASKELRYAWKRPRRRSAGRDSGARLECTCRTAGARTPRADRSCTRNEIGDPRPWYFAHGWTDV